MVRMAEGAPGAAGVESPLDRARRKAYRRLIPLCFISYVIAYVDRSNVAIAKLTMTRDLPGFDNAVIGFGAGALVVGVGFVAERRRRGVEGRDGIARPQLPERLEKHLGHAEDGVDQLAARRREWGQSMEGAVDQRVAVDDEE